MCCPGFLKMMMFIFNGCIFLAGAAILGVGVWVKVDSGSLLGVLENLDSVGGLSQVANVSYLLIAVGAVLLIMGFLGCCGAIRESRCMLLMFFIIVLIIFLVEVAGAVVVLVFDSLASELLLGLENEVRENIRVKYGEDENLTSLWNATMEEFECCGYRNYTDFDGSPFNKQHGGDIYPTACCKSSSSIKTCNANAASSLPRVDGCYDKLLQFIEDNAVIIAAVALGIAVLEIAAMAVSMTLYKHIGDKNYA
ncbi:tetraspanin-1-like [Lampris incognitus]|uniref:tetraspanin-1-like n=1 Tax=Lampris incognitus TaxID=2546036 RepID=UPI0024B4BCD1|nr:tetraspanin-1-like [Lampris incognitus]XP_056136159.1 tetraspanin-1-like [Lampris incognitus]